MKIECLKSSVLLFILISIHISAQTTPPKISELIGKRVRIYVPGVTDDWIKGKVEYASADSLRLSGNYWIIPITVPMDSIELLEVNIAPVGHPFKSILKGGLIGAAVGTSAGFIFWGINQSSKFEYERTSSSRSSYVLTRTGIGLLSGLIVGAILGRQGEKWKEFPIKELRKEYSPQFMN